MNPGKIIVLAFPDTFVKMSDDWLCRLLPFVGLGTREFIKAGHAALVLIENRSGNARYYDFGRYVTPTGHGRVRSAISDVELRLPFNAELNTNGNIENLQDFLVWLAGNPQKTHGEGRMLASICDEIDFDKAEEYILALQNKGSMPYSAFNKDGSNCSRFVTETILASTINQKIIKKLNFNKRFTPSTVGNVEKSATDGKIYLVANGNISNYSGSAFRENISNYFHRNRETLNGHSNEKLVNNSMHVPANAQKLDGIGSSAWFEMVQMCNPENFRIKRYNAKGYQDFDGIYHTPEIFDINNLYCFTYDSHCSVCHIIQNGKQIKFRMVSEYSEINSYNMAHSI